MLDQAIHSLAYAYGRPALRGRLRVSPEDFSVTELPCVEPAGEGEHVWLWVRKRNETTPRVAAQLARLADGTFASIDQDEGTVEIPTPMDDRLAALSAELNTTYIAYGRAGEEAKARLNLVMEQEGDPW